MMPTFYRRLSERRKQCNQQNKNTTGYAELNSDGYCFYSTCTTTSIFKTTRPDSMQYKGQFISHYICVALYLSCCNILHYAFFAVKWFNFAGNAVSWIEFQQKGPQRSAMQVCWGMNRSLQVLRRSYIIPMLQQWAHTTSRIRWTELSVLFVKYATSIFQSTWPDSIQYTLKGQFIILCICFALLVCTLLLNTALWFCSKVIHFCWKWELQLNVVMLADCRTVQWKCFGIWIDIYRYSKGSTQYLWYNQLKS